MGVVIKVIVIVICLATFVSTAKVDNFNIPAFDVEVQEKELQTVTEKAPLPRVAQEAFKTVETAIDDILNQVANFIQQIILQNPILQSVSNITVYDVINDVNIALNGQVLVNDKSHLKVNYDNLITTAENKIVGVLRANLKNNFLLLSVAEKFVVDNLNRYNGTIKNIIKSIDIPLEPVETTRQVLAGSTGTSDNNQLKNVISQTLVNVLRPVASLIDSTLSNITNTLLQFYQPEAASGYLESLVVSFTNQAILTAVDIIDQVRQELNNIFNDGINIIKKRSIDPNSGIDEDRPRRSIIDIILTPIRAILRTILTPIRFLILLISTPIHNILKQIANSVFITLRPVVGRVILNRLEDLVLWVIDLIPCRNCY